MQKAKKILLIYPETPPSFWGFREALKFLGKKESMPPLGLITVAAMFPRNEYKLKLIDMNVSSLRDTDIKWADVVLISAMIVHAESLKKVITRCNEARKTVVVGGPYATSYSDIVRDMGAVCLVIGEAENIFPEFLKDLKEGKLKKVYKSSEYPDITKTPIPRFDLLDLTAYANMTIQGSRGCPWDCEFCDITKMFGKVPRNKISDQILAELSFLYDLGWRGSIFWVDDNFIGNRKKVEQVLPEVIIWQRDRKYPFTFFTEASINLASMDNVMHMMVEAGFNMVFVGIESPNKATLKTAGKNQNVRVDLLQAIKTIRKFGLMVYAGFIVGLDGDGPEIFDSIIKFVQQAKIPIAMVGLLGVLKGTRLHSRLVREDRLLSDVISGSNTDLGSVNFIPLLDKNVLLKGYKQILTVLYSKTLVEYFERCWEWIEESPDIRHSRSKMSWLKKVRVISYSITHQLFNREYGLAYRSFLWKVICRRRNMFGYALSLAIKGHHLWHHTKIVVSN